jgi:hypothetical protein
MPTGGGLGVGWLVEPLLDCNAGADSTQSFIPWIGSSWKAGAWSTTRCGPTAP